MTVIAGISGSLRRRSYNTALLRAVSAVMPAGARLEIASIAEVPLYDGDVEEAEGIPPAVMALKEAIAAADGVLIATPEYNNGVPGVLKNALDWASRPAGDIPRVFGGKPVALVGASPGGFGTVLGQHAWLGPLRHLGVDLWTGGKLMVSGAAKAFDGAGGLVDEGVAERLRAYMAGFVAFVDRRSA